MQVRDAIRKLALSALVLGTASSLAGCVVTNGGYDDGYYDDGYRGRPPMYPADGYRYLYPGGVSLIFNAGLGMYSVYGYPDYYFHDGYFYRYHSGYWNRSRYWNRGWGRCDPRHWPRPVYYVNNNYYRKGHRPPYWDHGKGGRSDLGRRIEETAREDRRERDGDLQRRLRDSAEREDELRDRVRGSSPREEVQQREPERESELSQRLRGRAPREAVPPRDDGSSDAELRERMRGRAPREETEPRDGGARELRERGARDRALAERLRDQSAERVARAERRAAPAPERTSRGSENAREAAPREERARGRASESDRGEASPEPPGWRPRSNGS
jgi:hypothetical protein